MKIVRERKYVINMGNYESFTTGCQVEITDQDLTETEKQNPIAAMNALAEAYIGLSLAKDLKEAAEVSGVSNTFILTMEL